MSSYLRLKFCSNRTIFEEVTAKIKSSVSKMSKNSILFCQKITFLSSYIFKNFIFYCSPSWLLVHIFFN